MGPITNGCLSKGGCPTHALALKTFGGFDSTKDLPDDVITFARSHPAMYNPVHPIGGRPIMVRTDVDYQFSQLVVDRVEAEDGQYDVMFIGTDVGTVLKVVTIPRESWHDLEEVVLEEMTVFREPTPITAMDLSTKQIKMDDRVLRTDQGLLIRSLFQSDSGVYHCQAVEHGFIQPLLRLNLQIIPTQRLGDILPGLPGAGGGAGNSAKHRVWYRDFLSLLDHPELNSVEEFCDRVWKKERKQKKVKAPNSKSDSASNSALRPKAAAPTAQKQQASPPHSGPWLQAGDTVAELPTRSQNTQKGQPNLSTTPKNSQKTQNGAKVQESQGGSQVAGGARVSSQHAAKWRRMQENKKGRNRRTHELQRPPRSV
ncbi:hypothetical protein GOODEAATRI_014408 [Goodea atripinnis]|uniref:Sema domain-containing protein n=1 Tax=Goodea atripinnis TaxID=208336 RepID=A0ABV0MS03_9TELE